MRQWECSGDVLALGVLGSGVILALLSIKPAGRTKNPLLDPSVSQGLLFLEVPGKIFATFYFFPLSAHSQSQKTPPRATQPRRKGRQRS